MIGSSAAALIGLMFVVVTLTAGRARDEVERGKQLYTSPIVLHLAIILVISGAAIAPVVGPTPFAIVCGCLALLGIAAGVRSARRHCAPAGSARGRRRSTSSGTASHRPSPMSGWVLPASA